MKTALLIGLFLLAGCSHAIDKDAGIIHQPKSGCPAGYKEAKGFFHQRSGATSSACIDPSKEPVIDVLNPGESVEMTIEVPQPAKKKGEGQL